MFNLTSIIKDAPIDLRLIWSRLDRDVDYGRNALVKLAIRIFTVIANSAGCERVFSNFGNTHTKRRNKLNPKKVHNMAVVGMQIKREDRELGLIRTRKKRKFEETEDAEGSLSATSKDTLEEIDPTDFRRYAEGLVRQVELSNEDDNDEVELPAHVLPSIPPQPVPSQAPPAPVQSNASNVRATTTRTGKTQIPLANLFNYTLDSQSGLEFYWPAAKKKLEDELLAYDVAATQGSSADTTSSSAIP